MDKIEFESRIPLGQLKDVLPELEAIASNLVPGEFQRFASAMESASETAEINYRNYLGGNPIPGHGALKKPSGTAKSVTRRGMGLLLWAIGNDARAAEGIEEGTKEYDMKRRLQTAPKARVSKKGVRYLIIPFRHGTDSTSRIGALMSNDADPKRPKKVHTRVMDMAASMRQSRTLGSPTTRVSATGYTVPLFSYKFRDRLTAAALQAKGLSQAEVKRYQGMVRMATNGKTTHSNYITFRVMSENSKGWIRPAQAGFFPLQTAIDVAWTSSAEDLRSAFVEDVYEIITQGFGD